MIKDYNAMKKLSDNYGIYQDEGKIYLVRNIKVYDLNDKNALKKAVDDNICIFLNGGELSPVSTEKSAPSIKGLNGSGTFTFKYTYTISPLSTAQLLAKTSWEKQVTINPARLQVLGTIAGLSALSQSKGVKYSFSLTTFNTDSEPISRIESINVQLLNSKGLELSSSPTTSDIRTNTPGAIPYSEGAVDFFYTGSNLVGNSSILPTSGKEARNILNTDIFAGNNDGGSDGKSLQIADIKPVQFEIDVDGVYTIKITAVVKGNSAEGSTFQTISQTSQIRVVGANSCK